MLAAALLVVPALMVAAPSVSDSGRRSYPGTWDLDGDGDAECFDRRWLEELLATVDDFAARHDVPVAVNEFGVRRWAPGAARYMDDMMDLFEARGMNHALWMCQPAFEPQAIHDAFAFTHGPDPGSHEDVRTSDLIRAVRRHWRRNTARPGQVIEKWSLWTAGTSLRGANIYQRRVYDELDGSEAMGPGPVGPPYTQEDLDALAEMGANWVSISHPGLFTEEPPYEPDHEITAHLDGLLAMIERAGMFATITFRSGPGRSDFSIYQGQSWFPQSLVNEIVWHSRDAQEGWAAMWRWTAERYRDNPIVVGYDLMCEPNAGEILTRSHNPARFYPAHAGSVADWNVFYPRIIAAIREVDAEVPILVGAMGYSAVAWLPYLEPCDDPRTVYCIHQYAPFRYTHQAP